ncbi:MAG: transporter associated domain-containing protein, partial [Rikenellaceae bacterium]
FYDFLLYFDKTNLYSDNNYNTISGLIIEQLSHIPQSGEIVEWHDFKFEIIDMDGARIDKILLVSDKNLKRSE